MTVSLGTAIDLELAGFPQPEFAFGQLWETRNGREFAFVGTAQFRLMKHHFAKEIVFRPTDIDILRELTHFPMIEYDGYAFTVTSGRIRKIDDNPAEAAAMAWLEINEQNESE